MITLLLLLLPPLLFSLRCPSSHALPVAPPSPGGRPAGDELALLSFKSMLLSDGGSPALASWNASSHFCRWPGVACSRRHPERVVALWLSSSGLSGHISPHLGNLSFLAELDLSGNRLAGEILRYRRSSAVSVGSGAST
jgi:hypothetical protein